MRQVKDSERIFKKVIELNKQIKNLNILEESIMDEKELLSLRINNLRDYYHELTKPGFKIPRNGF